MQSIFPAQVLSLHLNCYKGIAVGLSHSPTAVWYLFFAIAAHKYVISFCCGVQFVTSGVHSHTHPYSHTHIETMQVKTALVILYIAVFSLISPVQIA